MAKGNEKATGRLEGLGTWSKTANLSSLNTLPREIVMTPPAGIPATRMSR
jgi:hypothetical protein